MRQLFKRVSEAWNASLRHLLTAHSLFRGYHTLKGTRPVCTTVSLRNTCINKEAKHVPLTINHLCFAGPLSTFHFLAFRLPSTVASLIKAIHIDYHYLGPHHEVRSLIWKPVCLSECGSLTICDFCKVWTLLITELAKMDISHLGLTITGGLRKDSVIDHACFISRFAPLSKLKTIDLKLDSAFVNAEERDECLEYMKKKLIKGYTATQKVVKKPKRTAPDESELWKEGKRPPKMAKQVRFLGRLDPSLRCF